MITQKDKDILQELLRNARQSVREISRKVKVSAVTVLKRKKSLEKDNIIKGYTCDLDYDLLGYDLPAIIRISIAKGKLFEVQKKIAANPNVHSIYDVTGDFDAVAIGRWKNRRSLDSFVKQLQAYQYITKTQTNLILNTIKESYTEVY